MNSLRLGGVGVLVCLLAPVSIVGCRAERWGQRHRPDIILISIDTLRADHLGCYGYPLDVSPNIDRFCRDSVLFSQAIAHAPSTLPSHASIFTSLIPQHHRASVSAKIPLNAAAVTVTEVLAEGGYQTVAVVGGGQLEPGFGLEQGFDVYLTAGKFSEVVELGIRRLDELDERPFFLFLHTYEVHHPYSPDPGRLEALDREYPGPLPAEISIDLLKSINRSEVLIDDRDLLHIEHAYDAEIQSMDEAFGYLVSELQSRGLYEEVFIVFTSDHGEEFGEHGMVGWHSHTLFEELLRVPLILKLPGRQSGGKIVPSVARGIDIAPTLLEVAAMERPSTFDGQSLLAVSRGEQAFDAPVVLERELAPHEVGSAEGLRTDRWKFAEGRLFDLENDRGEYTDVAKVQSDVVNELDARLADIVSRRQPLPENTLQLDQGTREKLRALGYAD